MIVGPPGSTDQVLIRGIGPSLAQFGVTGSLTYPVLTLYNSSGTQIATNESWSANSNFAQIVTAETTTGAFPVNYTSTDAALMLNLAPGSYTAEVSATADFTGDTGIINGPLVALAEVYEVSSAGAQIINISTRAFVGTGSSVEIGRHRRQRRLAREFARSRSRAGLGAVWRERSAGKAVTERHRLVGEYDCHQYGMVERHQRLCSRRGCRPGRSVCPGVR